MGFELPTVSIRVRAQKSHHPNYHPLDCTRACCTILACLTLNESIPFAFRRHLGRIRGWAEWLRRRLSDYPNSFAFDPPVQQPKNPSAVKLKLSTGAQRLYVVEGDNVLLATPVTVGTASAPTPHGNYTIYLKVANRRRQSSPGAGYPMTYWMEFKPAYGLHWGFVKPFPSTHGCVRMPMMPPARLSS